MRGLDELEMLIIKLLIELETNNLVNLSDAEMVELKDSEQKKILKLQRLARVIREIKYEYSKL